MPRKTKAQREEEARQAALLARPFAVDSTAAYAAQDEATRRSIAERIAAAKAAGASGNEMREEFGERLTGPARRKVLREFGFDGPAHIARSYSTYRDGDDRSGSRHAREHGARAEERRRIAEEEAAAAAAAEEAAAKKREAARKRRAAKKRSA